MSITMHSVSRLRHCLISTATRLLFAISYSATAFAQQPQRPPTTTDTTVVAPSETPDRSELRFTVAWISTGGSFTYSPGQWSDLHINLVNPQNEPRELMCATYFDSARTLEFCRKVWVPARSQIHVTHPALIPQLDPKDIKADLHTLVLDTSDGNETLIKTPSGRLIHDGQLIVSHETRKTALIGTLPKQVAASGTATAFPQEVTDCLEAMRAGENLFRSFTVMLDDCLPSDASSLNCFDHIVIQDDRVAGDLAFLSAIRDWVYQGGKLWIMLDRTDPRTVELLFGDDLGICVVDRIGLTTVRFDNPVNLMNPDGVDNEGTEFEEPVEMVRAAVTGAKVLHTINDWPASFRKRYGDGQIFVTTLGARGWIKPRKSFEAKTKDPRGLSEFVPTVRGSEFAGEAFQIRQPEVLTDAVIEPHLREYIGYSIPSWGLVVGLLGLFCVTLLSSGIWLSARQQLEYLGMTGIILAVSIGGILLLVGRSYRHSIPATIVSLQMVQGSPGTDLALNRGNIAIFQPEGSNAPIRVNDSATMLPDMTGLENTTRRLINTDLGISTWENLTQPAGLRMTSFHRSESFDRPLQARATFDSSGLVGKYSGPISPGTDPFIALPDGRIGVKWSGEGDFHATVDSVFEPDQFLAADMINDEQNRRRQILSSMFKNPLRKDFPDRPQLMFWTDRWSHQIHFDDSLKSLGSSLVATPLILNRPKPGVEFTIPAPFLPFTNRFSPNGQPGSPMWNPTKKEWNYRSKPAVSWFDFQVPEELLPIAVNRARIEVSVSGPVGRLEFMGLKNNQIVTLKTILDPVGNIAFDIDDAEVLRPKSDGGIYLGLSCGDPARPELNQTRKESSESEKTSSSQSNLHESYWQIISLGMRLWAQATDEQIKDQP